MPFDSLQGMPNFALLQDLFSTGAQLSDTVQNLSVMLEGENHAHH